MPLRLQSSLEIVDRGVSLVRRRAALLIGLSAAVQIPLWLILAILFRSEWAEGNTESGHALLLAVAGGDARTTELIDLYLSGNISIAIGRILPSIGLAILGAAMGVIVHNWTTGIEVSGAEAMKQVMRRGHVVFSVWLIIHLIEVVTVIGQAVGPLVFGIAMPLCMIEGLGPIRTITRSVTLSFKRPAFSFGVVLISTLLSALIALLIGGSTLGLVMLVTEKWNDLGSTAAVALVGAMGRLVAMPIVALTMALSAIHQKVETEGYDLQLELDEVERSAMASSHSPWRSGGLALAATLLIASSLFGHGPLASHPAAAAVSRNASIATAIHTQSNDQRPQLPEGENTKDAKTTASKVLGQEKYKGPNDQSPVSERIRAFIDRLLSQSPKFDSPVSGPNIKFHPIATSIGAFLLVALLIGGVVAMVARNRTRTKLGHDDSAEDDTTIIVEPIRSRSEWAAEADRLAATGDFRGAVRARFRALVAFLADRGIVADTPGQTAGELRREVAITAEQIAPRFAAAANQFEAVWYGSETATSSDAEAAASLAASVRDIAPSSSSVALETPEDPANPSIKAGQVP